jgi:hypothetical protein
LQKEYGDHLQIVLVSIEEEKKLQNFISARNNLSFPLVVDEDNAVTGLFEPPSYPYTVVLDRSGKILATITDAAQLTGAAISRWVAQKPGISAMTTESKTTAATSPLQKSNNTAVQLSQDFLYAARTGTTTAAFEKSLATMDYALLKGMLKSDNEKKAFWINLYNAFTNTILRKDPAKYGNRHRFFSAKGVTVAGRHFSLDDIEHGFLRRSRVKWSLGYIGKPFPSKTERELRVAKRDSRVHFALNCGAKSCPPIAYYSPERLDGQLDGASKVYLLGEATYEKDENRVHLPAIMGWFRADFGGKKGMRNMLKNFGIIPANAHPHISFKSYNWDLYLDNYREG